MVLEQLQRLQRLLRRALTIDFLTAVSTKRTLILHAATLLQFCTLCFWCFVCFSISLSFLHQFLHFPKCLGTPPQRSRLKLLHQVGDCGANSDTFSVVGTKALSHAPVLPKQTSRHSFGNFKTARLNKRLKVSALNTSAH